VLHILKTLATGAFSLVIVVLVLLLIVRLLENRLTFYPQRDYDCRPEDFGLSYEEITLRPSGDATIYGWYFKPRAEEGCVLVIFHGNAGNISHRLQWLAPFIWRGLGAVLFDYRGYGHSTGSPSEKAFQQDALALWDFLVDKKGLAPENIVSFGRSLGGAPAAFLASERRVGCLILEGAFTHGRDMARKIFGFLPVHLVMKNHWDVVSRLAKVESPVMILHGTMDEIVPFSLGEKLAEGCSGKEVLWWPVQGGGHLDLHIILGETYYERIAEFVRTAGSRG